MTAKVKHYFFFIVLLIAFLIFLWICSLPLKSLRQARLAQAEQKKLSRVFPNADHFSPEINGKTMNYWKAYSADETLLGYVFYSSYEGYRDVISVAVGVESDATIQQVQLVRQNETPGFDRLFVQDSFLGQFSGLKRKEWDQIRLATGATVSCQTVKYMVTEGVKKLFRNEVLIESRGE